VVNSITQGDRIDSIEIQGDTSEVLDEMKDDVEKWNKKLDNRNFFFNVRGQVQTALCSAHMATRQPNAVVHEYFILCISLFLIFGGCSPSSPQKHVAPGLDTMQVIASSVSAPVLRTTLPASWDENWYSSPAVFDIDRDEQTKSSLRATASCTFGKRAAHFSGGRCGFECVKRR